MRLVETHIISKSHPLFNECDRVCWDAKNLYNQANYIRRQAFIFENKIINYQELRRMLLNQADYVKMPRKTSNQTLMILEKNWKSFFAASRDFKKNPSKYTGRPSLPHYKDVATGRFVAQYEKGSISSTALKNGIIKLSQTKIELPFQNRDKKLCLVRVVPCNGFYKVEMVYHQEEKPLQVDNERYLGVDIGLNNLFAVCSNAGDVRPVIVNGRDLKSINQFWNKKKAYYQSKLKKTVTIIKKRVDDTETTVDEERVTYQKTKRLEAMSVKRGNRVKDAMHKKTRALVDYASRNGISKIVVGYNKGWKQNIEIGKRNNQNFVGIPHRMAIDMVRYKAALIGIEVIEREESYTSKCSFLDNEPIEKHENYLGRRVKRGLFKSKSGKTINADLNGAYNILKKEFPNAFDGNGIGGVAVHPSRLAA